LPRRGLFARADEILITLGTQEGLYLLAQLAVRRGDKVGVENPGYADTRHIFRTSRGTVHELPIDREGLVIGKELFGMNLVVVTPGCQCPTTVAMSAERRTRLLDWASREDAIIVEDDYEGEMALENGATALKSADRHGRVVYLGTFSKVLAPGMRLGYMVGPAPLIAEARALRRLIHRSPPLNNQRLAAIFMQEGYYQGLVRQLRVELYNRYNIAAAALRSAMPNVDCSGQPGSSIWLRYPPGVQEERLMTEAAARGVLVENGSLFFSTPPKTAHLRLGLSVIAGHRIATGVEALAAASVAAR
jgi:GntR family transcriptional regulator/MocR family aminotransferase